MQNDGHSSYAVLSDRPHTMDNGSAMTFEKIKVGDPVWIEWSRSRGKSIRQLSTVKKLTRTQIVTSHLGKKFYREDGREIAGSAYLGGIASPEELAEWNRQQEELANARRLRAAQEAERESKRRELNTLFLSPAANVRAD